MKEKFLPWFLLFCALGLSGTAAYYSVIGLSVVFIGVALPVIIMGTFLEISKIAIATYLHDKWKETYGVLKIYMTIALITLSVITSLGIYGLLSTGFQGNIAKLEIGEKQVKNVEVKKKRYEEIKIELNKEKTTLDGDITKLRDGLSNNTTTQTVDGKTGQLITKANTANRKTFESQLKDAQTRRDTISKKIDAFNDSITNLDVKILDMQSREMSGSELGTIKYISELTGWTIKQTANIFILILIFVFDPLAITLVIATNQAFKTTKKKDEKFEVDTNVPHKEVTTKTSNDEWDDEHIDYSDWVDEPIIEKPKTHLQKEADRVWKTVKKLKEEGVFTEPTEEEIADEPSALSNSQYRNEYNIKDDNDQEPTKNRPSTDQVDDEEYFEDKNYDEIIPKEVIKEDKQVINEPKRLTYVNRNGGSFRINRI